LIEAISVMVANGAMCTRFDKIIYWLAWLNGSSAERVCENVIQLRNWSKYG